MRQPTLRNGGIRHLRPCRTPFRHISPLRVNLFFAMQHAFLFAGPRPFGDTMENTVEKSCWGVTVRAVAGFAGILALAYLFGGF